LGALDENSIAWKTAERIHEEGGVFVLTNAQHQFVWVLLLNWLKKLAPQSFLLMRHQLLI
jgi:enoyl-[acyl-carrier-protein] reductase (NADH)